MLASILSLIVLAIGLFSFTRSAYLLGRDGLDNAETSRSYLSYGVCGVLIVLLAGFLNKSLE